MSASTSDPAAIRRWPLALLAGGALLGACDLGALGSTPADPPAPVRPAPARPAPVASAPDPAPAHPAPVLQELTLPAAAGWAAVVAGPARGHLEPCGCSGGQQGGIDRFSSVLAAATRGATGEAPRLAAGGVVGLEAAPHGPWARAQLESIWEAYGMLGLDVVGLGASDLTLDRHLRGLTPLLGPSTTLLASNLTWTESDAEGGRLPAFHAQVWDGTGGLRAVSFLPGGLSGEGEGFAWSTADPLATLTGLVEAGRLDPSGSNLVFLEGERPAAESLAGLLGPGSLVMLVNDEYEATRVGSLTGPEGGARIVELGSRLRQVARLEGAPGLPPSYDPRLVTEDVPGDASMDLYRGLYRMLLLSYDARGAFADALGEPTWEGYVGSEACMDCHQDAYEIWAESLHFQGMETLEYDHREGIAADQDPRCISCHAVGYGYRTGYGSEAVELERRWAKQEGLAGIGCENCHGPGALHVRTQKASDIDLSSQATCYECHDSENDPYFRFEEDWPLIAHPEPAPAEDG